MFKLRQTWSTMLPNATLYRIDKKIKSLLDPAWPITATEPEQTSIHVNPRFLQGVSTKIIYLFQTLMLATATCIADNLVVMTRLMFLIGIYGTTTLQVRMYNGFRHSHFERLN